MNNLRFIDVFNGTHASKLQTPEDKLSQPNISIGPAEDEIKKRDAGVAVSDPANADPGPKEAVSGPWRREPAEVNQQLLVKFKSNPKGFVKNRVEGLCGFFKKNDREAEVSEALCAAKSQKQLRNALNPDGFLSKHIKENSAEPDKMLRYCTELFWLMNNEFSKTTLEQDEVLTRHVDSQGKLKSGKLKLGNGKAFVSAGGDEISFGPDMTDKEIEAVMALQELSMRAQKRGNEEEILNSTDKPSTHSTPPTIMASMAQAKMRLGLPASFGNRFDHGMTSPLNRLVAHDTALLMEGERALRNKGDYFAPSVNMATGEPNPEFIRMRTDLFCMVHAQDLSADLSKKLIHKCTGPATILAMIKELQKRENKHVKLYFTEEKVTPDDGKQLTYLKEVQNPDEVDRLKKDAPNSLFTRKAPSSALLLKIAAENSELMKEVSAVAFKEGKGEALKELYQISLTPLPTEFMPTQREGKGFRAALHKGYQAMSLKAMSTKAFEQKTKSSTGEKFLTSISPDQLEALMRAYAYKQPEIPAKDKKQDEHDCVDKQLKLLKKMVKPKLAGTPLSSWQREAHFKKALSGIDDAALLQAVYLNEKKEDSRLCRSMNSLAENKKFEGTPMADFFKTKTGERGWVRDAPEPLINKERQTEVYFDTLFKNALKKNPDDLGGAFKSEFLRTQLMAQPPEANKDAFAKYKKALNSESRSIGPALDALIKTMPQLKVFFGQKYEDVIGALNEKCTSRQEALKSSEEKKSNSLPSPRNFS